MNKIFNDKFYLETTNLLNHKIIFCRNIKIALPSLNIYAQGPRE